MKSSSSYTRVAQVRGATLTGLTAMLIDVRASIDPAGRGFEIPGLPGYDTWPLRDRVRTAVLNSAMAWPTGAITVELGPGARFRRGVGLDLAIAVAILAADGAVPSPAAGWVFAAELGLDGQLRAVRGVVPVLAAALAGGRSGGPVTAVIAPGNRPDAAAVPGVTVAACAGLRQVAAGLRGEHGSGDPSSVGAGAGPDRSADHGPCALPVTRGLLSAAEVSAAGGHHLCVTGPLGTDIPALAAGLAGLLPDLTEREAAEATVIHSAAGRLLSLSGQITRPPLRIANRTCPVAAMIGGGTHLHPGEAALAHRGVLCLDDAAEFGDGVLRSLVQPLQDRQIVLARGGEVARFPARFILVAGLRPCRCGGECDCTPLGQLRYRRRVTGVLGAWLAIRVTAAPPEPGPPTTGPEDGRAGASSADRVAEARSRMAHRLNGTPWRLNGDIPTEDLRRSWPPAAGGLAVIEQAVHLGLISDRGAAQVTAVAWTLADLAGRARPGRDDCTQALAYRTGQAQ